MGHAALKIFEYTVGLHACGLPKLPVQQYRGELKAEHALLHATTRRPSPDRTCRLAGHITFRSLTHPTWLHLPAGCAALPPENGVMEMARLMTKSRVRADTDKQ